MSSNESQAARAIGDELESRWISLFLWYCGLRGISPEELVLKLSPEGNDILERFERDRRLSPGANLNELQYLDFPDYVRLASLIQGSLGSLGAPPAGWTKRLNQQNQRLIRYRNALHHAARFDSLPPKERQEAVALFQQQLDDITSWWPEHPYQPIQPMMRDESPIETALRVLSRDEQSARPLVEELGFEPVKNPTNLNAPGATSALAGALGGDVPSLFRVGRKMVGGGSVGVYLALLRSWPQRSSERERFRRRIAKALIDHGRMDERFLVIMANGNDEAAGIDREIEIVYPRQRPGRRFSTVRAVVELDHPTRYHLDLIRELSIAGLTSLKDVTRRWNEAFDVERVTRQFYREFRALRDRIVDALLTENPNHPVLSQYTPAEVRAADPTDDQRRFALNLTAFATRLLSRLLFLWFLQQKGWLGQQDVPGSRTFLIDLFRRKPAGDASYFSEALVPLFFDGLGRPLHHPAHRAIEERLAAWLGPILRSPAVALPYLDGGLFRDDADPFEAHLFGVGDDGARTLDVRLPNALFDPAKDNPDAPAGAVGQTRQRTILGLLRSYRFTTQESTPDDLSVDPDPELLGKVFEDLYQEDERHETGAYYTPREIVRYMCRQALDGYLTERAGVDQATLDRLREEAVNWRATDRRLSGAEEAALSEALDDVMVVDPAVGSGAFLVGMLQEIVLLRRGIVSAATDREIDRASDKVLHWKESAILRSLHGVDINPTAVEICRLRLWLSLVIEFNAQRIADIPALPNLEFRIVAGDSLVDRTGDEPLFDSLPHREMQAGLELQPALAAFDRARRDYRDAERDGKLGKLHRLGQRLRDAQLGVSRQQVDEAIEGVERRLGKLEQATKRSAKKIAVVTSERDALRRMRDGLQPDAPFLKPLLWPVAFPDAFRRGGFDIVVANPPYVRQEHLDPLDQEAYAAAFPETHAGTADLYVPFFARAVQLLRDGGWLAFITSDKYMRAAYGERLRAFLPQELQMRDVLDFGDLAVFSVAAYPAVVVGRKTADPDPSCEVTAADLTAPIRRQLRAEGLSATKPDHVRATLDDLPALVEAARLPAFTQGLLRGDGWILEDPTLLRLFHRLMNEGTPLGEYVGGRMYYGIKTGLNEAFVIDHAKRDELVAADPRSVEVIKPWLRGRDIKRWRPEWAELYLVAIQNSGDRDANNPWGAAKTEAEARRIFAATYPAIHVHLSQWESRLRRRADQGRWWWELRACAYYSEFLSEKLLWPRNIPPWETRFSIDESGSLMNDKAYMIPDPEPGLCEYLNSPLVLWLLDHLTTKLRGGYLELKSDEVVGKIPVPAILPPCGVVDTDRLTQEVNSALGLTRDEAGQIAAWYESRLSLRGSEVLDDAEE